MIRALRGGIAAALACATVANAQPARIGHYPTWKPGIQYFASGGNPTPAFKWGTGSAYPNVFADSATFTQGATPSIGDSLFIVLNGTENTGANTRFTGSLCAAMTPVFTLVVYAAETSSTSSAALLCYRKADGTEPSSFTTPTFPGGAFGRGLTAAYIDFSNGSSMGGSTNSNPFAAASSIASGQITATAGNVLLTFVANYYNFAQQGYQVTPASGSFTFSYDVPSSTTCTVCGDIYLQATTLASSGTTAVQNFTSTAVGGDYGNTLSAAIVP